MAKRIQSVTADAKVTLCTAQATAFAGVLPTPAQLAVVPDTWTSKARAVVPEFDLEIDAAGALDIAALELLAGMQTAGVVAADDVNTVDFANNELDLTAHGYSTGDLIPGITTTDNASGGPGARYAVLRYLRRRQHDPASRDARRRARRRGGSVHRRWHRHAYARRGRHRDQVVQRRLDWPRRHVARRRFADLAQGLHRPREAQRACSRVFPRRHDQRFDC